MTRIQITLTITLAVLLALLWAGAGSRTRAAAPGESRPFLPALGALRPARVELTDGEGKVVTLLRTGAKWGLAEADGYPVDPQKVENLVERLAELEVRRPAVSLPRYHTALKVAEDDFERHVVIASKPGAEPEVDFYLGTSPNYRIAHARLAGQDEVYAVANLAAYELRADPNAWIQKLVPEDPYSEATHLRLENAAGVVELDKDGEAWKFVLPEDAAGSLADPQKVGNFLRSANSLWVRKPVGKVDEEAQGLVQPAARLTLLLGEPAPTGADGEPAPESTPPKELVLRVGGPLPGEEDGEALRYLNRLDSGFTAAVRDSSLKPLLENGRAEFAPTPPAEEETAGPVLEGAAAPESPGEEDAADSEEGDGTADG